MAWGVTFERPMSDATLLRVEVAFFLRGLLFGGVGSSSASSSAVADEGDVKRCLKACQ